VLVPHRVDQVLSGQHRPRVGCQLDEQLVFLRGERHVGARIDDLAGALIQRQGAQLHPAVGRTLDLATDATEHRPDAGHQLAEPERLHHVIVGAKLQQQHPVDLFAPGRYHDDRHSGTAAQATAHLPSVQIGQPQVQQHQVGCGCSQGIGTVGHQVHVEALALQAGAQRLTNGGIVLDDQQVHDATLPCTDGIPAIFAKPLPSPGQTLSHGSLR